MGLKKTVAEKLGLTENIYVGVGLDRKRMRPPPGTAIIEIVSASGGTLALDTVPQSEPAPRSANRIPGIKASTKVVVGETGFVHRAFRVWLDASEFPVEIPTYLLDKQQVGARYANVWWSCEEG